MSQEENNNKIKLLNVANVLAYIVNTVVTFGVGVSGYFPTNAELSAKYQTLITPAGYAFSIWGLIFLAQFIWSIVQLTGRFRSVPLVASQQAGVGYLYIAACVFQCAWTAVFALEYILLSMMAMVCILVPLSMIVARQTLKQPKRTTALTKQTLLEYWLLKFPFEIHCGWIYAASLVNANVVFVAANLGAQLQVDFAWGSLGVLAVVALFYLWEQVWVIPLVLAWATYAIHVELSNPRDVILNAFSLSTIEKFESITQLLAFGVLGLTAVAFVIAKVRSRLNNPTDNEDDDTREQPLVTGDNSYYQGRQLSEI